MQRVQPPSTSLAQTLDGIEKELQSDLDELRQLQGSAQSDAAQRLLRENADAIESSLTSSDSAADADDEDEPSSSQNKTSVAAAALILAKHSPPSQLQQSRLPRPPQRSRIRRPPPRPRHQAALSPLNGPLRRPKACLPIAGAPRTSPCARCRGARMGPRLPWHSWSSASR